HADAEQHDPHHGRQTAVQRQPQRGSRVPALAAVLQYGRAHGPDTSLPPPAAGRLRYVMNTSTPYATRLTATWIAIADSGGTCNLDMTNQAARTTLSRHTYQAKFSLCRSSMRSVMVTGASAKEVSNSGDMTWAN